MNKCIVYDGPYTLTDKGLKIGTDETIFKYLLEGETLRFSNNGLMYSINIRKEPFIINGKTMIVTHHFNDSLEQFSDVMKNVTESIFDDNKIIITMITRILLIENLILINLLF